MLGGMAIHRGRVGLIISFWYETPDGPVHYRRKARVQTEEGARLEEETLLAELTGTGAVSRARPYKPRKKRGDRWVHNTGYMAVKTPEGVGYRCGTFPRRMNANKHDFLCVGPLGVGEPACT